MSTSTQVSNLKINKMTREQYDTITPSETELYFLTDDSGITSADVINALGYTPYSSANPNNYVDSSAIGNGTITFVQDGVEKGSITANQFLDTTINLETGTSVVVDQTYNATSTNAQSGTAVAGAISTKQDIIDDLSTIRAGATAGATALQPEDVVSTYSATGTAPVNGTAVAEAISGIPSVTVDQTYGASSTNAQSGTAVAGALSPITTVIPSAASSTNQLADKSFVNSSISSNTANFIGTFSSIVELEAYSGTVTNNDYAFVINGVVTDEGDDWATFNALDAYSKDLLTNFDYAWVVNGSNFDLYRFDIVDQEWSLRVSDTPKADVTLNTAYNRYKASVVSSVVTWEYEYTLNNSSFTASQWAAINSEITANTKVTHTDSVQVGDTTTPVYVTSSGAVTALSYTLSKSVPSNALFTDTTYTTFGGADGTSAGSSGLVPAPTATDNTKFLKGDGTWDTPSGGGAVDQTYNPSSTNAQSGTAVAGAVSGLQDASTAVTHTASTSVGNSTTPVYIASNGVATVCSRSIPAVSYNSSTQTLTIG